MKIFGVILQQDKVDKTLADDTLTSDNRTKVYNDSWIQQVVICIKYMTLKGTSCVSSLLTKPLLHTSWLTETSIGQLKINYYGTYM